MWLQDSQRPAAQSKCDRHHDQVKKVSVMFSHFQLQRLDGPYTDENFDFRQPRNNQAGFVSNQASHSIHPFDQGCRHSCVDAEIEQLGRPCVKSSIASYLSFWSGLPSPPRPDRKCGRADDDSPYTKCRKSN